MAEAIYVINRNGYIGSSTAREIAYAKVLGKGIQYMEAPSAKDLCCVSRENKSDLW